MFQVGQLTCEFTRKLHISPVHQGFVCVSEVALAAIGQRNRERDCAWYKTQWENQAQPLVYVRPQQRAPRGASCCEGGSRVSWVTLEAPRVSAVPSGEASRADNRSVVASAMPPPRG